jgi:hypothetical protein
MNFKRGLRRIGKHFAFPSVGLAAATLIGFCQPAAAQTTILTSSGVATGAIGCAPSNNGTGHMVCLEYSTSGSLTGLSWQAPPASGGNSEVPGTVDTDTALTATAAGTPMGTPGCGSEDNGTGAVACVIVSKTSSGGFSIQGVAFYPPTDILPAGNANKTTPSGLVTLATEPANTTIGNPSCTATNQTVTGTNGTAGGAVVCAITINGQLFGVGFEPKAGVASALTSLLSGVTGNPSCTSAEPQKVNNVTPVIASDCAVRESSTLEGFAVTFTPPPSGSNTATVAAEDAIVVGSMSFAGDPSCTVPPNGQDGATSFVATCGIVSGTTLFGVSFDPINAIPNSSPSAQTTAFQSLGAAPDSGHWTGSIGCSTFPDFRALQTAGTNSSPNQNLIGCGALSSTDNVFEVTFDPRAPVNRGVVGPFGTNANANLSCLPLAIDQDRIYCGGTTTSGASGGYLLPVGVLAPGTMTIIQQSLLN